VHDATGSVGAEGCEASITLRFERAEALADLAATRIARIIAALPPR